MFAYLKGFFILCFIYFIKRLQNQRKLIKNRISADIDSKTRFTKCR